MLQRAPARPAPSPSTSTPSTPAAPSIAQRPWITSDSRKRARLAGSLAAAGREGGEAVLGMTASGRAGSGGPSQSTAEQVGLSSSSTPSPSVLTQAQGVEAVGGRQGLQVGGGVAAGQPAVTQKHCSTSG